MLFTDDATIESLTVDSTGGGAALAAFNADLTVTNTIDVQGGSPSILTMNGVTSASNLVVDGESSVTIGTGAMVTIANSVIVGDSVGAAATAPVLEINGFLEADSLIVGHQDGIFGEVVVAGFNGEVTTTGAGPTGSNETTSQNVLVNELRVGVEGSGELTIEKGAQVAVIGNANVAEAGGSEGTVVVSGDGSRLTVEDEILIANAFADGLGFGTPGAATTGTLTIEGGGTVVGVGLFGAVEPNSVADITVTGFGSNFELERIGIGDNGGTVNLTISDGGRMAVTRRSSSTPSGPAAARPRT